MNAPAAVDTSTDTAGNGTAPTAAQHCYHCALPLAGTAEFFAELDGVERPLCCAACKAVAETIAGSGLGSYYRFRSNAAPAPASAVDNTTFAAFDQPEFQRRWVGARADGSVEAELLIGGMHCAACAWLLENHLRRLPGVRAVQVDLSAQSASLCWLPQQQGLGALCAAVAALGYRPQPCGGDRVEQLRRDEQRSALRRLGVAGVGMMQVGMCALGLYAGASAGIEPVYRDFLRWISLLVTVPVLAYAGRPFFSGAWRGLRARRPGMDLPVALALALATAASVWATLTGAGEVYFDSVTMFLFLLLGSRYLELRARHYSGRLSGDLLSLLPLAATRIDADGGRSAVPPEQLQVGDTVLVAAGAVIPADGSLLDARASIGEAALTGEFMPVPKRRGDTVLAGSVNGDQSLTFRVSGVGAQLRLAAIHSLSRRAQAYKPRIAQLADRLAGAFAGAVVVLAGAVYLGWLWFDPARAFWVALSVLVVSCPCALGLATPTAIAAATAALRRQGLLVTRADAWESLPQITDVVFDKTGTLTEGRVRITAVQPCAHLNAAACTAIAAALEAGCAHPIAHAFADAGVAAASGRQIDPRGVEGSVGGQRYRLGAAEYALDSAGGAPAAGQWVVLAAEHRALCWFRLDDTLRADAHTAVAALRARGLELHLLSGDASQRVAELAQELGIGRALAGAAPAHKLEYVNTLQAQGRRVLMVGDGINDLPVLAAADVSVAMHNASQLAKTGADCILLAERLERLPLLLDSARRARNIVRENLAWALLYNAICLPLAAAGWIAPWLAALGMSLSSLLVTGNALRLQRAPRSPAHADHRPES